MTLIAAKVFDNRIEVAADSSNTFGDWQVLSDKKIFKVALENGTQIVIGLAGSGLHWSLFKEFWDNNGEEWESIASLKEASLSRFLKAIKEYYEGNILASEGVYDDSQFLIASSEAGLATLCTSGAINNSEKCTAIGCLGEFAQGCMVAGKSPLEALEIVAEQGGLYCKPPFITETIYTRKPAEETDTNAEHCNVSGFDPTFSLTAV